VLSYLATHCRPWCSLFLDGILAALTGLTGDNRLHVERKYYTRTGQQKLKRLQLDILASCDGAGSGDDGDIVHHRTKFITLGLNALSASGGLSGCVLIM